MGDTMQGPKKKETMFSFNIKRFIGFIRIFIRNKRALLGLSLIFFFVFIALAAPFFTPYTSLGEDPNLQGPLAGKRAAPTWLRYLPTWLGGNPDLSENLNLIGIECSAPKTLAEGGVWNASMFLANGTVGVNVGFNENVGYPFKVEGFPLIPLSGSLAVSYQRSSGQPPGISTVYVYRVFDYPFSGLPARLRGNINLLVNGSSLGLKFPDEEWFVIQIDAPLEKGKPKPYSGNISISVDDYVGIHIAAANITVRDWLVSPDKDWWKWLNNNWEAIKWVVSEGSLVNKTYDEVRNATYPSMYDDTGDIYPYFCFMEDLNIADPDLEDENNRPDIYYPRRWFTAQTILTDPAFAGDLRLKVADTSSFKVGDYISIGSGDSREINQIKEIGVDYFVLYRNITRDHDEGELVVNHELVLYENITVRRARFYIVMKVVVTEPKIYQLRINVPPSTTVAIYSLRKGIFRTLTGTTIEAKNRLYNILGRNYITIDATGGKVLLVPIKIRVLFGALDVGLENLTKIFPPDYIPSISSPPRGFYIDFYGDIEGKKGEVYIGYVSADWILSKTSPWDPGTLISIEDPVALRNLFKSMPGKYIYGIEITFIDNFAYDTDVVVNVYIDNFGLFLDGTSFGILGTDHLGRDLFAQLIYGTRISLYVGILVALLSVAIGLVVGLFAGYVGGAADQLLMRINDLMLVMPGLPLLIVLVAVLGARIENLIILLGLLGWNGFARVVRSQVLSLKERPFVEAARAAGAGTWHIIFRHILPNVMSLAYISLASSVPGAITAEAALAWLGFSDPTRMSWGRMLHDVFEAGATRNWWWIIPPGLAISLVAMAFILLGYALDEILNPKLRMRR